MTDQADTTRPGPADIAIVGMALHVPGARTLERFWDNLKAGTCSIRRLTADDLSAAGEDPSRAADPAYVAAAAVLDGYAEFDAEFFGLSPKDAAIMDPQHRRFLEVTWAAMENAGFCAEDHGGQVGIFAGCGMGNYLHDNLRPRPDLDRDVGLFLLRHTGNDKDFLTTRASHLLNLNGPSIAVQTACSTSLVATHLACQSLRAGECDMALAGGVTIELPHGRGYLHKAGEILSPDGYCRAFDHRAGGTVFGSGAGVVALRRLEDALRDGDRIWAVIRGTAVNNDGASKAGYLAPSVDGQAAAARAALEAAGVGPDSIGFVECHGTGTPIGDPIEVAALNAAYAGAPRGDGTIRIGSVKANIGHLDTAAGVTGLIKAALCVHHGEIVPVPGFEAPNPDIDFAAGPFRVADKAEPWPASDHPRRASVNSLGVGGTNAHVVLEAAPEAAEPRRAIPVWPHHVLQVSAHGQAALATVSERLADWLEAAPDAALADVAYTLSRRPRLAHCRAVVAGSVSEAVESLRAPLTGDRSLRRRLGPSPDAVFMFPGGGAQYAGMGRDLYATEPVFRDWMDCGLAHLKDRHGLDLMPPWLPDPAAVADADRALDRPAAQIPLIFLVEHALAQMLRGWGIVPSALIGHSLGENTAAVIAGVMDFEQALDLVTLRGRLFERAGGGGMISVPLSAANVTPMLGDRLSIAAINAPDLTTVSGPTDDIDALAARLARDGIEAQRIAIDVAAHSAMLDPVLDKFRAQVETMTLSPPKIPLMSNLTGEALTADQATDPEYWVRHLRSAVRFADGVAGLARPDRVFIEVGPGRALSTLARMTDGVSANQVIGALRHRDDPQPDDRYLLQMLGELRGLGLNPDLAQVWAEAAPRLAELPSYPFSPTTYFIDPPATGTSPAAPHDTTPGRFNDQAEFGARPEWVADSPPIARGQDGAPLPVTPETWLVLVDPEGLSDDVVTTLRADGHRVITVATGDRFARTGPDGFVLAPEHGRAGFDRLVADLAATASLPARIASFWLVSQDLGHRPGSDYFHRNLEQGLHALTHLMQALTVEAPDHAAHVLSVSTDALGVGAAVPQFPEKALSLGPVLVGPREFERIGAAALDLSLADAPRTGRRGKAVLSRWLCGQVMPTLRAPAQAGVFALREGIRLRRRFVAAPLEAGPGAQPAFREGGAYLVTGGTGAVGLTLAERAVERGARDITLVARSAPRIHARRRIEAMRQAGARVTVARADVCNLHDMQRVVYDAQARAGRIDGVIHAAGMMDDAPMLERTVDRMNRVLAPKVFGMRVLDTLFPDGATDWIALCSSTSTAIAPPGQTDYVAANAYLDAFAASRCGRATRVVAIDWGIWGDGMAARAAGCAGHERAGPQAVGLPTFHERHDTHDGATYVARLDPGADWRLDGHRLPDGTAILPGTAYVDLLAEAMQDFCAGAPFIIRDLAFLAPFAARDGTTPTLRLDLAETDDAVSASFRARDEAGSEIVLATARIAFGEVASGAGVDPETVEALSRLDTGAPLRSAQEHLLRFGPAWKSLRATLPHTAGGTALLALPEAHGRQAARHAFHPALADIATGWGLALLSEREPGELWVPMGYGSIALLAPLPAQVVSRVEIREEVGSNEVARFDILLADMDGRPCVRIRDFGMRKVGKAGLETRFATEIAAPAIPAPGSHPGASNPRLQRLVARGLTAAEGADAFEIALARSEPQLVVTSMPLDALAAHVAAPDATPSATQFDRPALEADFVAPRTPTEEKLASMWQGLLGLDRVGVDDDFFALGGHSLIAVRLFAAIRKAFGVDFPISVLFEAPTIAACARLIDGPGDAALADEQADIEAGKPRPAAPATVNQSGPATKGFRHLVPMHTGEPPHDRPVFMVAGMFGNVLNLRHLGTLVGAERPFYGIQARGLFGGDDPHASFEEMAAAYIAEIRAVQPDGPYMIGGFSGGGNVALETARQLRAAGAEIGMVALLDTPLPQRIPLSPRDRALIQLAELKAHGPAYVVRWARNRLAWEIARRQPSGDDTDTEGFHNQTVANAFLAANAAYRVTPWDGPLTLFRPPMTGRWQVSGGRLVNSERAYVLPDNGWRRHAPGLEVIEVPGDHDSMVLEPNVRVLAAHLLDLVRNAEARLSTPERFREAAE